MTKCKYCGCFSQGWETTSVGSFELGGRSGVPFPAWRCSTGYYGRSLHSPGGSWRRSSCGDKQTNIENKQTLKTPSCKQTKGFSDWFLFRISGTPDCDELWLLLGNSRRGVSLIANQRGRTAGADSRHHLLVQEVLILLGSNDTSERDFLLVDL